MAESGAFLIEKRKEKLQELLSICPPIQASLSNGEDYLSFAYQTSIQAPYYDFLLDGFKRKREKEIIMGYTLLGPHKDDFEIHLQKKLARLFASEGQQRLCALSLRMGEWEHIRKESVSPPILCIDEMGMGLDAKRRERAFRLFTENQERFGQIFLTSPNRDLDLPLAIHAMPVEELVKQTAQFA